MGTIVGISNSSKIRYDWSYYTKTKTFCIMLNVQIKIKQKYNKNN